MAVKHERSLAYLYPEIAKQWHPTKNGDLKASEVATQSNKKRWWVCDEGHEWSSVVANRTRMKSGCPVCSGYQVLEGFNDLATTHPQVAAEWHPMKNGDRKPTEVTVGSDVKHWWLGGCGHSWQAVSYGRAKGYGCPVCAGKKVEINDNDLASKFPELAELWHPTKNGELSAQQVTSGSKKHVWWRGTCGHEWDSMIVNQVRFGSSCPYCSGRRVLEGFNDLATLYPDVAAEWHPDKNGELKPTEVTIRSDVHVWWLGKECGHAWRSVVKSRTRLEATGCPQCWGNTFVSRAESEVATVIKTLLDDDVELHSSIRSVIKGELDIYVPERNLAIEFSGLYWHSEQFKNSAFHASKSKACAEKGIHLIHVWEDDWRDRRDIVVRAIAHRLNAAERLDKPGVLLAPDQSLTQRYGARTLSTEVITYQESAAFLEANHIQGKANGTIHTGLRDKDGILRAVFVAKRVGNKNHEGEWRIEWYATRGIVPGGFTKLMKFTQAHIQTNSLGDLTKWVTFSDGALSDGGLYRNYGFIEDGFVKPDYQYVVNGLRVHKFNYRLRHFRDDPTLQYEEGLSERELALLNNIPRIWDSGKTRWVKNIEVL